MQANCPMPRAQEFDERTPTYTVNRRFHGARLAIQPQEAQG